MLEVVDRADYPASPQRPVEMTRRPIVPGLSARVAVASLTPKKLCREQTLKLWIKLWRPPRKPCIESGSTDRKGTRQRRKPGPLATESRAPGQSVPSATRRSKYPISFLRSRSRLPILDPEAAPRGDRVNAWTAKSEMSSATSSRDFRPPG